MEMYSLVSIGRALHFLINIYIWIVIAGALITWVSPDPFNPLVRFLKSATDPVFRIVRKNVPWSLGGVDFTPIVVIAILVFLDVALVNSLIEYGNVIANILLGVGQVLYIFFNLYMWIIIISVIISWVTPNPYNPIARFLYTLTEPVLAKLRTLFPLRAGRLDLSPAVAIVVIIILNWVVSRSLIETGLRMKIQGGF
ncbi:MAG: YggT family protein [Deltaproteobacteria bacterium]|nr:YggT family protein [Deltaproteobacteria bacterium]